YEKRVVAAHLLDGKLALDSAAHDARRLRLELHEPAQRRRRASFGPHLEQVAEEDETDDEYDGLVVQIRRDAPVEEHVRRERPDERVQVRRSRADSDERVHVERPMPERRPSADVELPSRPE